MSLSPYMRPFPSETVRSHYVGRVAARDDETGENVVVTRGSRSAVIPTRDVVRRRGDPVGLTVLVDLALGRSQPATQ